MVASIRYMDIWIKRKKKLYKAKGVDKYPNLDSIKKIKSKKLIVRKKQKVKPSKLDLVIEHQKKVPIIYEELKK